MDDGAKVSKREESVRLAYYKKEREREREREREKEKRRSPQQSGRNSMAFPWTRSVVSLSIPDMASGMKVKS